MKGILCFGDSITFGRGEIPNKGWCGRLKNWFEVQGTHNAVYNLGIPGGASTDLLERFNAEANTRIRLKRPTDEYTILIAIGANDCKFEKESRNPRTTDEHFKENIKNLIKKAKSYKAKLAFIGLIPVDEKRVQPFERTWFINERVMLFNEIIKELCQKENILFLDIYQFMIKEKYEILLFDGLHPNTQGYDYMFNIIKKFIEKNKLT